MRHRRFRSPEVQWLYDKYRAERPTDLDRLRGTGSIGCAYVVGFTHATRPTRYVRNSLAYAAWAAGVDNRKEASA